MYFMYLQDSTQILERAHPHKNNIKENSKISVQNLKDSFIFSEILTSLWFVDIFLKKSLNSKPFST